MTDTTKDIAAMRESIAKAYEGVGPEIVGIYVKTLESILDKFERAQRRIVKLSSSLEAERQRADEFRQSAGYNLAGLESNCEMYRLRTETAEAKLAAIKGKQVPVAVVELNDNFTVAGSDQRSS